MKKGGEYLISKGLVYPLGFLLGCWLFVTGLADVAGKVMSSPLASEFGPVEVIVGGILMVGILGLVK